MNESFNIKMERKEHHPAITIVKESKYLRNFCKHEICYEFFNHRNFFAQWSWVIKTIFELIKENYKKYENIPIEEAVVNFLYDLKGKIFLDKLILDKELMIPNKEGKLDYNISKQDFIKKIKEQFFRIFIITYELLKLKHKDLDKRSTDPEIKALYDKLMDLKNVPESEILSLQEVKEKR